MPVFKAFQKPCPYCAEPILKAATVCRFCGSILISRHALPKTEENEPLDTRLRHRRDLVIAGALACAGSFAVGVYAGLTQDRYAFLESMGVFVAGVGTLILGRRV